MAETTPGCISPVQIMTVPSELTWSDVWGDIKSRIGIARLRYAVSPGLYAIGKPDQDSPVLVTANYRMTFNKLRVQLSGRNVWVLVLDTKGINVWCAAGKGTFGTKEIVERINKVQLHNVVSHRRLILPQLGAPGVSAHHVREKSGFSVIYGPVYAKDLPTFLDSGLQATPEMRRVQFPLWDRIALAPLEMGMWLVYYLAIAIVLFLLGGLTRQGYLFSAAIERGLPMAVIFLGTYILANILGPALLPLYPTRAFSLKGLLLGCDLFIMLVLLSLFWLKLPFSLWAWTGIALTMISVSSFVTMNFTGCTTFTSLSGVIKEMKIALPWQIVCFATGIICWIIALFF